ncbi:MAG: lysophospholipase L1-like esterase [Paraglaciecola sp.]|jgi:lysophospholipase L1-like esterase
MNVITAKRIKKKVLIITDSLGLPRCIPEEVSDDDTWCYKLTDHFSGKYNFRFFRHRGLDTAALIHHLKASINAYQKPDIVILQIGVVDCYPRALSLTHLSMIKKTPKFVQDIIHKIVNKNYEYFVNSSDNRYVKPVDFVSNLKVISEQFKMTNLYVLPIAPACNHYIKRNSKIEESIDLYNEYLKDVFGEKVLSSMYKCTNIDNLFLSDGHHLSSYGHDLVFRSLISTIAE